VRVGDDFDRQRGAILNRPGIAGGSIR